MIQILFCDEPGIVRVIYLIKTILNILKYSLPIILIFMVTLDLYKNMINGNHDNKETIIKKSGNRILACIVVFCVPTLINLVFSLISKIGINASSYQADFAACYTEASLSLINELEANKELQLDTEEEEKRKKEAVELANFTARVEALKEQQASSSNATYSSKLTDLNKQNRVYLQNGSFYVPKYNSGDSTTYSGKDCPKEGKATNEGYNNDFGYNNYFYTMLSNFINGAKSAGYKITMSSQGCRSYVTQTSYYSTMEKGRAARPGNSLHGWGIASDLTFYKSNSATCPKPRTYDNCPSMKWAHEHAKDYGLEFPLLNASYKEDWHIQPINLERY